MECCKIDESIYGAALPFGMHMDVYAESPEYSDGSDGQHDASISCIYGGYASGGGYDHICYVRKACEISLYGLCSFRTVAVDYGSS